MGISLEELKRRLDAGEDIDAIPAEAFDSPEFDDEAELPEGQAGATVVFRKPTEEPGPRGAS